MDINTKLCWWCIGVTNKVVLGIFSFKQIYAQSYVTNSINQSWRKTSKNVDIKKNIYRKC